MAQPGAEFSLQQTVKATTVREMGRLLQLRLLLHRTRGKSAGRVGQVSVEGGTVADWFSYSLPPWYRKAN
jgi:hypothetical protein